MRFNAASLRDGETRVQNFIRSNGRLPNYLTLREMDNTANEEVPLRQYCGLYFSDYTFWLKNGRHPNFVTLNIEKGEPIIQNYQDNSVNCCPASLSMVSTKLFKPKSEQECASALGTTQNGTNPANLVANAPKLGFTAEAMKRTPKNVSEALSEYKGVMVHYMTKNASCSGFINQYGHYAVIKSVGDGRYTVMDPTKGTFTCPTSVLDQATAGRSIYYYRIGLR